MKSLWLISVAVAPEAEEAVSALLEKTFNQPATIETNALTGATRVSLYPAKRSEISPPKLQELKLGLKEIRRYGLRLGSGRISIKEIPRENWAESWKRHFKPFEISPRLLIKPSWSKRRPGKGQALLVLDPGLSFGTGQHPTTRFCLEHLAACRQPDTAQSLLDIGTGSGILALAAVQLGYHPVYAFDSDPDAVRIARRNARQNRLTGKLQVECCDLARVPKSRAAQYDVICANLMFDLLKAERPRIITRLKPTGVLILAGLLRAQFAIIRKQYEQSGLKLARSKLEQGWQSGVFTWQ